MTKDRMRNPHTPENLGHLGQQAPPRHQKEERSTERKGATGPGEKLYEEPKQFGRKHEEPERKQR